MAWLGNDATAQELVRSYQKKLRNGNTWPNIRVKLAELQASRGKYLDAIKLLNEAVDLGWRDINTLEASPFLVPLFKGEEWALINKRIEQELSLQRTLIQNDRALIELIMLK